jgi:RNA polymerase sigma-70 factor (ECF subfamily)
VGWELYQAVMALPAKYRLPLYLYYFEGYAVAEVGQLLGLNPSTVQTRLARARAKLKQELGE